MKIGLSFGRCLRDIVDEKVNIDDILVIIARTKMANKDILKKVVEEYTYEEGYLLGKDYEVCMENASMLWDLGKIFQPRLQDGFFNPYIFHTPVEIWMDVVPSYSGDNVMVREAYNNYLMLRRLSDDS